MILFILARETISAKTISFIHAKQNEFRGKCGTILMKRHKISNLKIFFMLFRNWKVSAFFIVMVEMIILDDEQRKIICLQVTMEIITIELLIAS